MQEPGLKGLWFPPADALAYASAGRYSLWFMDMVMK